MKCINQPCKAHHLCLLDIHVRLRSNRQMVNAADLNLALGPLVGQEAGAAGVAQGDRVAGPHAKLTGGTGRQQEPRIFSRIAAA